MKFSMKAVSAALVAAAAASAAQAGGFMLTEQSVAGLGRAYAGAGIMGDDASAVWYNPAGMTLLPGVQIQVGGVFVDLDLPVSTVNGSYSDNGQKYAVPIPNMFLTAQMSEDMWFGLGITVPYGMATEYNRDSPLNYWGMNSEIKVFDINPSVAWKVNEKFSIGAGMSIQYATAQFESAKLNDSMTTYGRLNADSWAWGANIGVMWSPTETLRFGLAYRSQVNHNADGYWKVGYQNLEKDPNNKAYEITDALGGATGRATLSAPHTVMLTGVWEATEKLTLSALIRWANWSSFDSLQIKSSVSGLDSDVENDWGDSWLFTVGADYKFNKSITGRIGVGYEISPVDDDVRRTAVIPDTDRLWLAIGATWHVNENLQGDFGFAWLHGVGDMGLYMENGTKVAEFDKLEAYMFGAQFVYKF